MAIHKFIRRALRHKTANDWLRRNKTAAGKKDTTELSAKLASGSHTGITMYNRAQNLHTT